MKKEIKSSSKRKWIVGGVAFFGALALLTTGFATWIIGANNTNSNGDVSITVDTAQNKSLDFSITMDDSEITLKDSDSTSGDILHTEGNEDVKNALQISFTYKITYGKSLGKTPSTISFAFATGDLNGYVNSSNTTVADNVKINKTTAGGDRVGKTYLDVPNTYTISALPDQSGGSVNTIDVTTPVTVDFKYGTFFDNQTPTAFYNTYANNDQYTLNKGEFLDNINSELGAMRTLLDGKKIKLVATVNMKEEQNNE